MVERKSLLKIFASLVVVLFLTGVLPGMGTAAPAEKTYMGMEWGTKYWPTKPVRGGITNAACPLYIGLMNPQPLAGKRLGDHWTFL